MRVPKTTAIGYEALLEREARKEQRLNQRPGLQGMSDEMREEKKLLLKLFHMPVKSRDGQVCVYCSLFFHRPERPATYGDHMLTRFKWPEFKFFSWVGAATCDGCNSLRQREIIKTCIMQTTTGVIQFALYDGADKAVEKLGIWQARKLFPSPDGWKGRGDQVGEFIPVPATEAARLDLRNNVLI